MNSQELSEILIYPIKSLGGISLQSSIIEKRGLQYDRRWMIVDENNKFITQRVYPQMSLLNVGVIKEGLVISHKIKSLSNLIVPFENNNVKISATVWNDKCIAKTSSKEIDEWFSEALELNCKLVYMPNSTERMVDSKYSKSGDIVSFADGYPFLIIGQSSLDFLNSKLNIPIPMNRFRPNFVFKGGKEHIEDKWKKFKIGSAFFEAVKPCSRCVLTTVNQETGVKGKEPLATLSRYRSAGNKVLFGQNLVCKKASEIKIGDIITLLD